MDADTETLLRLAFERAPAAQANAAIQAIREQTGGEFSLGTSYEVLLPEDEPRAWLLGTLLPRLVDYLESRGASLPLCPGVFLSVFSGEGLHFLRARDVVALLAGWSGLSLEAVREKYRPR